MTTTAWLILAITTAFVGLATWACIRHERIERFERRKAQRLIAKLCYGPHTRPRSQPGRAGRSPR
jgi:hypothetical protein